MLTRCTIVPLWMLTVTDNVPFCLHVHPALDVETIFILLWNYYAPPGRYLEGQGHSMTLKQNRIRSHATFRLLPWRPRSQHDLAAKPCPANNFFWQTTSLCPKKNRGNFMGTKLWGLTTMGIVHRHLNWWMSNYTNNITKVNKYLVGIFNLWIAQPTKYAKWKNQWVKIISLYHKVCEGVYI